MKYDVQDDSPDMTEKRGFNGLYKGTTEDTCLKCICAFLYHQFIHVIIIEINFYFG